MWILDFFKNNPYAVAILGGTTSSMIVGYLLNSVKWIPNTIISSIMAHITTVVQLNESQDYSQDYSTDKIRELELYIRSFKHRVVDNSLNLDSSGNYIRLPEGIYYIFKTLIKHKVIMSISVTSIENKSAVFKALIYRYRIKIIGFNKHRSVFVNNLQERLENKKANEMDKYINDKIIVATPPQNSGLRLSTLNKRDLSSIYTNDDIKEHIMDHINNFINNRHVYDKYKVTYKTGIILHGEPGTGKTSLVRAIASSVNCILISVNKETSIKTLQGMISQIRLDEYGNRTGFSWGKLQERVNPKTIPIVILFEEIDKFFMNSDKKNDKAHKKDPKVVEEQNNDMVSVTVTEEPRDEDDKAIGKIVNGLDNNTLDNMLQFFDGIESPENVIFVATTNYIERLDPALIRPGRFDLCVEMKRLTKEKAQCMVDDMMPGNYIDEYKEFIHEDGTVNSSELFTKLISEKIKSEVFGKTK